MEVLGRRLVFLVDLVAVFEPGLRATLAAVFAAAVLGTAFRRPALVFFASCACQEEK